jgi:hypothetical protein
LNNLVTFAIYIHFNPDLKFIINGFIGNFRGERKEWGLLGIAVKMSGIVTPWETKRGVFRALPEKLPYT